MLRLSIRRLIFIPLVLWLFFSIAESAYWARDYQGLLIVAVGDDEVHSYNPFSRNFSWISPTAAVWILTNFEYPYEKCVPRKVMADLCELSRLDFASLYIFKGPSDRKVLLVIQHLLDRWEPVNGYQQFGMTALHQALMMGQVKLARLLLENGANVNIPVEEGYKHSGKDAYGIVGEYYNENSEKRQKLIDLLEEFK